MIPPGEENHGKPLEMFRRLSDSLVDLSDQRQRGFWRCHRRSGDGRSLVGDLICLDQAFNGLGSANDVHQIMRFWEIRICLKNNYTTCLYIHSKTTSHKFMCIFTAHRIRYHSISIFTHRLSIFVWSQRSRSKVVAMTMSQNPGAVGTQSHSWCAPKYGNLIVEPWPFWFSMIFPYTSCKPHETLVVFPDMWDYMD